MNLADPTSRLARWLPGLPELELYVVCSTGIKHQAVDALTHLLTTGADTSSIEDDLSAATTYNDNIESTKVRLGKHQLTLAQVVEDNDSLNEVAAPSIADFLLHQATDLCCRQAAHSVSTRHDEYTIDKNRLITQVAPLDGAVQTLVHQALWKRLLYHSPLPVLTRQSGQRRIYDSTQKGVLLATPGKPRIHNCQ